MTARAEGVADKYSVKTPAQYHFCVVNGTKPEFNSGIKLALIIAMNRFPGWVSENCKMTLGSSFMSALFGPNQLHLMR